MHELALSQSIVNLVLERARAERLRTVTRVVVAVGAAAGVDAEALRFCRDVVVEETAARGAELVIDEVPLQARCRSCRQEFGMVTERHPKMVVMGTQIGGTRVVDLHPGEILPRIC
jgi:hydrogenase nickel incorporation protein HypA/HybF